MKTRNGYECILQQEAAFSIFINELLLRSNAFVAISSAFESCCVNEIKTSNVGFKDILSGEAYTETLFGLS